MRRSSSLVPLCITAVLFTLPLSLSAQESSSSASSDASNSVASSSESSSAASSVASSAHSSSSSSSQSSAATSLQSSSSSVSSAANNPLPATILYSSSSSTAPIPTGNGSITVEQKNEEGMYGTWTLLPPSGSTIMAKQAILVQRNLPAGRYTLFIEPPKGTAANIRLYRGSEQLTYIERPQLTFTLNNAEDLRIVIHYPFTRTGEVAVTSDPPGLSFHLSGPNGLEETGTTPAAYTHMPEGLYSVQFDTVPGCVIPARTSQQLKKGLRASFSVTIACAAADELRKKAQETEEKLVTTMIAGEQLAFHDVPTDAWFAAFVFRVAKAGILSGYKDEEGNLTGEFGPERNVTVAELAKIAHEATGTDEFEQRFSTKNLAIRQQWYAQYLRSAEGRGWTIYMDGTINPDRDATRAEVLVTLYQAFDVPLSWQKGNVFSDVTVTTPFASAVETAARAGIVSGRQDATGAAMGIFDPQGKVVRAELAKILTQFTDKYRTQEAGSSSSLRDDPDGNKEE